MSGMIGQRIKEMRVKKGMTQEELGQHIGITTQAVSKWERGGTPDAEILPKVAEVMGVTTDYLFGLEDKKELEAMITEELASLEGEEAFQRAFSMCWAIEMGLTGKNSLKEKFTPDILDGLNDEYGHQIFSRLLTDSGLIGARVSKDGQYFFLMPEPENGFGGYLSELDQSAEIFEILSDKRILNIISYMYSRKNTPVSLTLLSSKTHLDLKEAEILMNRLSSAGLAICTSVETESGEIKTYTYCRECSLIPLLTYSKELRAEKTLDFVAIFGRTKPLF